MKNEKTSIGTAKNKKTVITMHKNTMFRKAALATAVALAGIAPASATEFNFGDLSVQWDNTISYGVAWRTEAPDPDVVAVGNGEEVLGRPGRASSNNYDDGTLNFAENSIYTNVVKYSTDLELNYNNYGGFFRARAFYDTELMDGEREFKELSDETKDAAGAGYDLLDAFVWADYDFGNIPVSFRLGRQVVSWGESTFIQGGINSINPVDASAFRRPGAEVKEGLLPVNMFYTTVGITPDVSIEAFYQIEWEKTRPDPCGTFFATADFVADGCGPVILASTEEERVYLDWRQNEIDAGFLLSEREAPITERLKDNEPKDDGQYGLAVRWYSEALGDTEFGAYFMNIHSRLPFINGVVTNDNPLTTGFDNVNPNPVINTRFPLYQISYPEDNQLMGISFATSTDFGASLSGEISYRPDAPIQWNAFEVLIGGLGVPTSRLYQRRLEEANGDAASLFGNLVEGYDELDIWQAQMTFIQFFDQALGADRIAVAAEIGATYVPDLPDVDEARYGRSGIYGLGDSQGVWTAAQGNQNTAADNCLVGINDAGFTSNENSSYCTDEGFVNELSGGIRVRAGMDFNNLFAGVNVTPNMAVSYDMGNGPEPGAQFINERLTTSVGVNFVYQNQTQVSVSYTNFEGGDYNQLKDHDNVALSASYSF